MNIMKNILLLSYLMILFSCSYSKNKEDNFQTTNAVNNNIDNLPDEIYPQYEGNLFGENIPDFFCQVVETPQKNIFVNLKSVQRKEDNAVEFWALIINNTKQYKIDYVKNTIKNMDFRGGKTFSLNYSNYSHSLNYYCIKCDSNKFKISSTVDYNMDGSIIIRNDFKESESDWVPIATETIADVIKFNVCQKSKLKSNNKIHYLYLEEIPPFLDKNPNAELIE